jgi:hypothetical protein
MLRNAKIGSNAGFDHEQVAADLPGFRPPGPPESLGSLFA